LTGRGLGYEVGAQDPAQVEADDHHEHDEEAVEQKPVAHCDRRLSPFDPSILMNGQGEVV